MYHKLVDEIWDAVPGMVNVMFSGTDGIIISRKVELDEDEYIIAEAASLIKEGQRFGKELDSGGLRNMVSQYEEMTIVIQMITHEYFLMGLIKDQNLLGRLRYRLTMKSYEWYELIA